MIGTADTIAAKMSLANLFVSDHEISAIGRGVLDLSLPKPCWTHAAHFAAALWLISCRADLDASCDMPGFIRAYNEATGVANTDTAGYHETITQASLRAARSFLREDPQRALSVEPDLQPLPF